MLIDALSCDDSLGSAAQNESLFEQSTTLESSIMESLNTVGGVQVIHHNVQGLFSKLCEVNKLVLDHQLFCVVLRPGLSI